MHVLLLGVHNAESVTERLSSVLIDNVLALDAGSLTRSLPLRRQPGIRHVFLTHRHYDHIRDVPALAYATPDAPTLHVYGLPDTIDAVSAHLLNDVVYPRYQERTNPDGTKRFSLHTLEIGTSVEAIGHRVTPFPAYHTCPAVGYLVERADHTLYYTGDTGPGFTAHLPESRLDILLAEVTYGSAAGDKARENGHLTPALLREELAVLDRKGLLPAQTIAVHMNPAHQPAIEEEIQALASRTGWRIEVGFSSMALEA